MQLHLTLTGAWASGESPGSNPADDRHAEPNGPLSVRRGSIMIVEDDEPVRETLADILEYEGYSVYTACDGREALARLNSGARPSLILLDLMMPRMNGWEFRMEQLRSQELSGIPVAILSGAFDVRVQAALLGVREFLGKPIEVQELLELVGRFCG